MAFGFQDGEALGAGLARILLEELQGARAQIADPKVERGIAIHQARRHLKRARSLARVLAPITGADSDRRRVTMRDAARLLSARRDADVMLAEAKRLAAHAEGPAAEAAALLVRRLERQAETAHGALLNLDEAAGLIRRAEADAASLPRGIDGARLLQDELIATYRAGRSDFRDVADGARPFVMHDWRKQVKHRWHLTLLLTGKVATATRSVAEDLNRLGECLGEEHDLSMLKHRLATDPSLAGPRKSVDLLLDLIAKRRRRLKKKALELGEELYGDRTKRFAAALTLAATDPAT